MILRKYLKYSSFWVLAGGFFLTSCQSNQRSDTDILASHIDTTVRPQDDFFEFANGKWIKDNPIPAAYRAWGIGDEVQVDLYNRLKIINEQAVKNPKDAISKQIAAFYASGMDTVALAAQSMAVLTPEVMLIDSIQTPKDVLEACARLSAVGVSPLFRWYIGQDDKNSSQMITQFSQGGLGLPNRDYYLKNDKRTTNIRTNYKKHIGNMLAMTGMDISASTVAAEHIYDIEKQLATASSSLEALRDPYANYHKFSTVNLDAQYKNFNWGAWLNTSGIKVDSIIIGQPAFFKVLDDLLGTVPVSDWKLYLKWHLVHRLGTYVNLAFEKEHFNFYGKVMNGLKKQKPRWRRVISEEENAIGEALGQLFVKAYFPEKAKQRYTALVEEIRTALKERINKLDWMSTDTKKKALYKLSRMTAKVGYPDHWKDFSEMKIIKQPFVKNIMAAKNWWHAYNIAKLDKPVDRSEWHMTPQTYNAYYNPANNEIVLPAGIFTVPGKTDAQLDDAIVYGYAGASTIGHEITHGFDDQGRLYDADGNLSDWWTKQDGERFSKRAAVMIKQFDRYNPIDSLHINGEATLGENIADLGGILLGYEAYQKTAEYKAGKKIGGFTPKQRFFLGYALGWLYSSRPERLAQQLLTDVHSPAKYRVNGPFSDVDAFYEAFDVKPGDKMYIDPKDRVRIW